MQKSGHREIERKFLVKKLPEELEEYPFTDFEQGYLCVDPVLRVRREGADCFVTYKGGGLLSREEYNLPLTDEAYAHLLQKADGIVITKRRYRIPTADGLVIELDVFVGKLRSLVLAEVEFASEEEAKAYVPPAWFGREVTYDSAFHNSTISRVGLPEDITP